MNQNLCPFCFDTLSGLGPCSHCGHQVGEPIQGFQQLPVGWILDGKYRIGMTLGQGGFGITYLAYDMNLQQKVAIKEYFPSGLVTRNSQFVTPSTQSGQGLFQKGVNAFYREARLLVQFSNNPNVVHIQNFFRENNTAYFVMEYVEGKSLEAYLNEKGGRLSQEETISLLSPIMDALDTLHQAGILHRDIATDNIYMTKSGQVKLLDFGAAKNELSQHTHSSAAILKPGYAPLEQYSVTGNQGPWTDVYAMGAVIYRCLTGVMPPDAPDRITGKEIIPIGANSTKVSKNVEAAVMKALALYIPDRWQRMIDFKKALSDPSIRIKAPNTQTLAAATSNNSKRRNNQKNHSSIFIWIGAFIITMSVFFLIIILISGKNPFHKPEPTNTPTATATITPLPTNTATVTASPTFTPTPIPSATPESVHLYTVKEGDSCFSIALEFGIDLDQFMSINNMDGSICSITIGDQVIIPETGISTNLNTDTTNNRSLENFSPKPGDNASYESQFPEDGKRFDPGEKFNIVWYLWNTGSTTWTSNYYVQYFSGHNFADSSKSRFYLTSNVNSGYLGEFHVEAVAPSLSGSYTMSVALANAYDEKFYIADITIVVK